MSDMTVWPDQPLWPPDFREGCRIVGIFLDHLGNAINSSVRLTPAPAYLINPAQPSTIFGRVLTLPVVNGILDFVVPPSDDPDVTPTNWTYAVVEDWPGGRTYNIEAPAGGTVDLTLRAPIAQPPEAGEPVAVGPPGPAGSPGPPGPAGPAGTGGGAWMLPGFYYAPPGNNGLPVQFAQNSTNVYTCGGLTIGAHSRIDQVAVNTIDITADTTVDIGIYQLDQTTGVLTLALLAHGVVDISTSAGQKVVSTNVEVQQGDRIFPASKVIRAAGGTATLTCAPPNANGVSDQGHGALLASPLSSHLSWPALATDGLPATLTLAGRDSLAPSYAAYMTIRAAAP